MNWQRMVEERSFVASREFHFPFASRSESCSILTVAFLQRLFLEGKQFGKGKQGSCCHDAENLLAGSQTPSMLVVGKNKPSVYFGYLLSFLFRLRIFVYFCDFVFHFLIFTYSVQGTSLQSSENKAILDLEQHLGIIKVGKQQVRVFNDD
jgi:hypothetical protein